jgi:hypothetical protein
VARGGVGTTGAPSGEGIEGGGWGEKQKDGFGVVQREISPASASRFIFPFALW